MQKTLLGLSDDFCEIRAMTLFLTEAAELVMRTAYVDPTQIHDGLSYCFSHLNDRLDAHNEMLSAMRQGK